MKTSAATINRKEGNKNVCKKRLSRVPLRRICENTSNTRPLKHACSSPLSSSPWQSKRVNPKQASGNFVSRIAVSPRSVAADTRVRQRLNAISTSPVLSQFMVSSDGVYETPTREVVPANSSGSCHDMTLLIADFIYNGVTPSVFTTGKTSTRVLPPLHKSEHLFGRRILLNTSAYRKLFEFNAGLQCMLNQFMDDAKGSIQFEAMVANHESTITISIPNSLEELPSLERLKGAIVEANFTLRVKTATGRYAVEPASFNIRDLFLYVLWEDVYFAQGRPLLRIEMPGPRHRSCCEYKTVFSIRTEDTYAPALADYLENQLGIALL